MELAVEARMWFEAVRMQKALLRGLKIEDINDERFFN